LRATNSAQAIMRGQTSPINQQNLVDVCAGVSLVGEVKEPGYLDGGVFCMFHDTRYKSCLSDLCKTSIAGVNIVGEVKEPGYLESSDL